MDPTAVYTLGFVAGLAVLLLVLLEVALRFLSRKPSPAQNVGERNPARALVHAGDVVATLLIAASVARCTARGESFRSDAIHAVILGVSAELLFLLSSRAQVRFLLSGRLHGELDRGNVAVGIAAGSHSLATGVLAANAINADDLRSLGISFVFFALAQATVLLLVMLFRWLTSYDDVEEVLGENAAAAVSYAGITVSVALLVSRAVEGDFTTWGESLPAYALVVGYAPLLYVVRQFVVGSVLLGVRPTLRGGVLDRAIGRERNVGLAALEAAAYLGTALLVLRMP